VVEMEYTFFEHFEHCLGQLFHLMILKNNKYSINIIFGTEILKTFDRWSKCQKLTELLKIAETSI